MQRKSPTLQLVSKTLHLVSKSCPSSSFDEYKGGVIIPNFCQFWGTATLLTPVAGAPKGALICGKTGQKLSAFSLLKGDDDSFLLDCK